MSTQEEMRSIVRRHIHLWKTASHSEWRALFTPDYTIEDPVGTGERLMGSYETEWHNMHTDELRLDMEPYRLIVGGREIVADLRAVTHLGESGVGPDSETETRNTLSYTGIYTVDDAGLLCANRTFADPVPDHLWQAFYPTLPPPSERPPPALDGRQIRQAIEDHLYFWNCGSWSQWRGRFRPDATIESPVGTGPSPVDTTKDVWEQTHRPERRRLLGCHRVIVGGMEALAHAVAVDESPGLAPRAASRSEIFAFDDEGYIVSWRVFEDERWPGGTSSPA